MKEDCCNLVKPLRADNWRDLDDFCDKLDVYIVTFSDHGRREELMSASLYQRVQKKLPTKLLTAYQRHLAENRIIPDLISLQQYLAKEAEYQIRAHELVHGIGSKDDDKGGSRDGWKGQDKRGSREGRKEHGWKATEHKRTCIYCDAEHPSHKCTKQSVGCCRSKRYPD